MTNNNPKIIAIQDYVVLAEANFLFKERQGFYVKNKPYIKAIVLDAFDNQAFLLIDNYTNDFQIGDELIPDEQYSSVQTSLDFFGHVIDIDNRFLDIEQPKNMTYLPVKNKTFSIASNMMHRRRLDQQLYTGIHAIDLFNPIGLGQRELILGDRQTGKTHIALNTIINQKNKDIKCIYVSIGQKRQSLSYVYNTLKTHGALEYTMIIDAPSTSAFQQFLAPYIAMAHAENLAQEHDVLVIYDDLTKHANIYREISLLTNKPIAKEAYPADVFYAHSSLLERSGAFISAKTITCLPIITTIDNDVTSLIASNVISITDGQIIMNANMFANGQLPAVDIDLSVSRTGSSVQTSTIAKIASNLSKIYRAYRKQIKLSKIHYEFDERTQTLMLKGQQIANFLLQRNFQQPSKTSLIIATKAIDWELLTPLYETSKLIQFLSYVINNDLRANQIFKKILNEESVNEQLSKAYFASVSNQFYQAMHIDYQIKNKIPTIGIKDNLLASIIKTLKD
ncbi:MSC_0619 family F1-like ATPase alpha subunit [Ureaplasma zalophigenitalium]|uniref:ATP F0F1 synthase subunit alpha n=1 Tax=Ureaplasma zalophigenitalium TaxID=907723 RepID=A0ABT3BPG2_9BACT|nr:ATP F0F1 synthase subunit alpha [Ureaplasma zalophigenitalium]MCV3754099.1 ATP F0F1 synthase subunit alpha [Ureaplasma zalophigenitalium]